MRRGVRRHVGLSCVCVLGAWLAGACQPPCPEGYTAKLDQCVQAVPHACDVLEQTKPDPGGDTVMSRINLGRSKCFWMDQTEVTVELYQKWLNDDAKTAWEADYCKWKKTKTDPISDPSICDPALSRNDQGPFGASKPIRCVDFCDAEAYCRWAGKRLCYDIQALGVGGPRGEEHEWVEACSNSQATVFPWGDTANELLCQTGQDKNGCPDSHCGPIGVGQRPDCRNTAGVLDLIGNVAEWTYACTDFEADDPACLVRGGSYAGVQRACTKERITSNSKTLPDVGFRCCEDLSGTERAKITAVEE